MEYTTTADQSAWANEWCYRMISNAASNGVVLHPIIYSNTTFAGKHLSNPITQWQLWMATSGKGTNAQNIAPTTPPWSNWSFFQYISTLPVNGVSGDIDRDVFHGTSNVLFSSYIVGNTPPQNINVITGSNATFTVAARQSGPLYYQWSFNQAAIAGATGSSFTISNAQPINAGPYSVNVANTSGTIFAATALPWGHFTTNECTPRCRSPQEYGQLVDG